MTDEQGLLTAVWKSPEDSLPRVVYADFLQERGNDVRAEFIRVSCRLAGMEREEVTPAGSRWRPGSPILYPYERRRSNPERAALRREQRRLANVMLRAWPANCYPRWDGRGFIRGVNGPFRNLRASLPALVQAEPFLRSLDVMDKFPDPLPPLARIARADGGVAVSFFPTGLWGHNLGMSESSRLPDEVWLLLRGGAVDRDLGRVYPGVAAAFLALQVAMLREALNTVAVATGTVPPWLAETQVEPEEPCDGR